MKALNNTSKEPVNPPKILQWLWNETTASLGFRVTYISLGFFSLTCLGSMSYDRWVLISLDSCLDIHVVKLTEFDNSAGNGILALKLSFNSPDSSRKGILFSSVTDFALSISKLFQMFQTISWVQVVPHFIKEVMKISFSLTSKFWISFS